MALCAALSFAPDALADDGSYQDAAHAPVDAVQVDTPAGGAGTDSPSADVAASDVAAEAPAADADADVEAGSIDAGIPADPGQAADGGDADGIDSEGFADGADGDAASQQPPAADGDGTASVGFPAGADGTLSGQDDAPSIPATMDRPTVGTRDASSASISWAAVDGASAYEVRWSSDGVNWTSAIADSACFDALGLDPDRRYLFQVRAIVGQGDSAVCGDWSASRAFTTPYLISYGLNGGVQAAGQRGWYRQTSATYILLAPTRNGYDFAGWYSDESLSDDAVVDRILHGSIGNVTFFAKWSQRDYTVTYVLNGSDIFVAKNSSTNPLTYQSGSGEIGLASAYRAGYRFDGWYLDEGLTQRIYAIPEGSATDMVLYAKWQAREYAIRYVLFGDDGSLAANSQDNPGSYLTGQQVVLADPMRNYHFFLGWFLDDEFTMRLGTIPAGCTGSIVLYAKWQDGVGDLVDIDRNHQDTIEYAQGTVKIDDAVYTVDESGKVVSIDLGAADDPDALSALVNSLKAGQVLMLMPTAEHPNGYCIRFDSLSIVNGIAIVSGSAPSYEELLDNIDFEGIADSGSYTFTPSDDVTVIAPSSKSKALLAGMSPMLANEVQLIKLNLKIKQGMFSAEVSLTPGIQYKISDKGGKLYAYIAITGKLEAKCSIGGKIANVTIPLGSVSFPFKALPVLSLNYEISLVGSVDGSLSLKATQNSAFGFEYKDDKPNFIGKTDAKISDFEGITGSINSKIGVEGDLSLKVCTKKLLDVALGTGLESSVSATLRDTAADQSMLCVDSKTRVYAEISFGGYSMLKDKLSGSFSFPWLDEKSPVHDHYEKKGTGPFVHVSKCTWKNGVSDDESESGTGGSSGSGSGGSASGGNTVTSGKCGKNVYWSLKNGILRIWGQGGMYNGPGYAPGASNKDSIVSAIICKGVSSIGNSAFEGCTSLASVTIPDSVTSIGWDAFAGCTSLASVTIPDSVTSIGWDAFRGCTSLASVTIPDSVTSIGWYAFRGCTSLASVTIPDSVTSIGEGAFFGCTSLASVVIPDSVTSIGDDTFVGCNSLASVHIGDSVASIGWHAFEGCTSLASVTIPDSVTWIGYYAFEGCASLASVTIPDSVTSIGTDAFRGCTSLASVTIPDSVTSIGSYAFNGCNSLASVTIPDSVTSIGSYAFNGCNSLASVHIGDSVISIGEYAFNGCNSLASVVIPDSVTSIGSYAFNGCNSLASVHIGDSVTSISGWIDFRKHPSLASVYIGDSVTSICNNAFDGCSSLVSVRAGNAVSSIGDYAFRGCSTLATFVIPESVASIGFGAFDGCVSLSSICIPDSVSAIDKNAFRNCKSLASVTLSNSMLEIPEGAFDGCTSLAVVSIPDSVGSIGDYAFRGCSALTSIVIPGAVTTLGSSSFSGCSSLTSVSIPSSMTEIGKNTFSGCTSLVSVTLPSALSEIPEGAFDGCSALEAVIIPTSVTTIGAYAFSGCASLVSVDIPNSVKIIWDGAFKDCTSLTSFVIPNSVTTIWNSTFKNCTSLTSVVIPDSVIDIFWWAFDGCTSLTSVTLSNSATNIGYYAFRGCTSLVSVEIPDSVTEIGQGAFQDCTSLTSVIIPDSVTYIGAGAFNGCSSLLTVSIPSCATLGENAFDEGTIVIVRTVVALDSQSVAAEASGFISCGASNADGSNASEAATQAASIAYSLRADDIQVCSNESQLAQQAESSGIEEAIETQEQDSLELSAVSDDSVMLIVLSEGVESQAIIKDSNLPQDADIIVFVAVKDDDGQQDCLLSSETYRPDSVLIA